MAEIIGRKKEIEELNRLYHSDKAQFVAVYGRRRVGKTYLVNQVFKDKMTFHHTGLSPFDDGAKMKMHAQLQSFHYSLLRSGMDEQTPCPKSWLEAFYLLENCSSNSIRAGGRWCLSTNCRGWTRLAAAS